MNTWRLIWVGRPRSKTPESSLADRYVERISRVIGLDQQTLKPAGGTSSKERKQRESKSILDTLTQKDFVVLLDERGKQLSSEELAGFLSRQLESRGSVIWVIGGSNGVSSALRQRADFVLSLSKMTMPHALARVFFLEQLYRAMCINSNHPYHHEG